ncbi:PTS sugar transporter subunit IIC [Oceanobacillus oncorhynchi]|uniref:PTS sugar transporter subunit IIC n=1 Tax=Oceanobacillus oncorhynchi TaxID=545501 RepID=UPI0034D7689E
MNLKKINQGKLLSIADSIQNNKYLMSVSNGLMASLPILMIGAISIILSSMPFEPYQNFITDLGIKDALGLPANLTINIMSIYIVFFVAYRLAESHDHDALAAGTIALISFLILTPFQVIEEAQYLPFEWLGAQGLFVAMIVGVLSTYLYMQIVNRNLVIKMPESVPPTVQKTFASILPGIFIVAVFTIISVLFESTNFGSIHQFIYNTLQIPMQHIGGSFGGLIVFVTVSNILWLFGIHGSMVTNVVAKPLLLSMDIANLAAFQAGEPLPFVISWAFRFLYSLIGGGGCTLGLCLLMAFKAKSKQLKAVGKISLPTSLFSINEPLIFGVPIVLNPILAIPFIFTPLVTMTCAYLATVSGIIPTPIGVFLPTGTPVLFSAFVQGGILLVLFQFIMIGVTVVCYYPFFKKLDKDRCKEEAEKDETENKNIAVASN